MYSSDGVPIDEHLWRKLIEYAHPLRIDVLDTWATEMAQILSHHTRYRPTRNMAPLLSATTASSDCGRAGRVYIVSGEPGSGKSTMLAHLVKTIGQSDTLVIAYFAGALEEPDTSETLLTYIERRLELWQIGAAATSAGVVDLPGRVRRRLEAHAAPRRILIVIDGLDEFAAPEDRSWLPPTLSTSIHLVLSGTETHSVHRRSTVDDLVRLLGLDQEQVRSMSLAPLSASEAREVVEERLREERKTVPDTVIETLCAGQGARNLLAVHLLVDELLECGEVVSLPVKEIEHGSSRTNQALEGLMKSLFERKEVEIGLDPFRSWCTYLSLAPTGMPRDELRGLVAQRHSMRVADIMGIESRMTRYLRPRGGHVDFSHPALREAAVRRYIGNDAYVREMRRRFEGRGDKM